jgi:hypothetical protein
LVEEGYEVDGPSPKSFTPLMHAAAGAHLDVVRFLIQNGADVKAKRGVNTPLKVARGVVGVSKERKQALMALLEGAGENIDPAYAHLKQLAPAAQRPEFLEAVRHAGGLLGTTGGPWKRHKGVYQFWHANLAALPQARADARSAGFCLVESRETALMFPTNDKYVVIAACGTGTNMRGLDTHDLIVWFRDMERENPFELTLCSYDQLAGEFVGPLVNELPLAERMMQLCPEIDGPVEDVARDLRETRAFSFWWD